MEEISMAILSLLSIYILGSLSIVWLINFVFNAFNDKNTKVKESSSEPRRSSRQIHKS